MFLENPKEDPKWILGISVSQFPNNGGPSPWTNTDSCMVIVSCMSSQSWY